MKIVVYIEKGSPKYCKTHWSLLFSDGLRVHDIDHEVRFNNEPVWCDLAVLWGKGGNSIKVLKMCKEYLLLERGYIGERDKWTSLAYNGLNGRGNFNIVGVMPKNRWDEYHSHLMKSWNPFGDYVLIIGQKLGDSSISHVDFTFWVNDTIEYFESKKIKFKYRPHPGPHVIYEKDFNETSGLIEQIRNAKCVITFNSTVGVVSLLEGKPTIAIDEGSMAYDITEHHLVNWDDASEIRRKQWAYNLSYCQWSEEEFANGTAWEHIKNENSSIY